MRARMRLLAAVLLSTTGNFLFAEVNRELKPSPSESSNSVIELASPGEVGAPAERHATAEDVARGELVRQRFPDGGIHVEKWVIENAVGDFVNHGEYRQYDATGQVEVFGRYHNGQRHGEWTRTISVAEIEQLVGHIGRSFQPPFSSKANFDQGMLSEDWSCSDANGNPVFVWGFKAGKRNGLSNWYDGSGEIIRAITYKNNLAHGPAKVIVAKQGQPQDIQFEDGRMRHHVEQWYPATKGKERKLKSQDWFLIPTPLNLASHDWSTSLVEHQQVDDSDKLRHGQSVSYYPNGNRQAQGNYDYGKRSGTFAWWYANGQERTIGAFADDLEQGEWTWWHENGMKQALGTFEAGVKVATWSVWDEAGKLTQRTKTDTRRLATRGTKAGDP